MKSVGVMMAVAVTSVIVLAIGIFSFLPRAGFEAPPNPATVIPWLSRRMCPPCRRLLPRAKR